MRTFVAIEIPEPLKAMLDRSLDALRSGLAVDLIQWVRPGSMHLTLKFLGEIDQQQVHAVQDTLDEVAEGFSRFTLEIKGLGCFPNRKRPRVLWAGLEPDNDDLLRLQAELANRFEEVGFEREHRDFHAHLTIGRVRKGLSGEKAQVISSWVQKSQLGAIGDFEVVSINLVRSDLKPSGAVYTNLYRARLAT